MSYLLKGFWYTSIAYPFSDSFWEKSEKSRALRACPWQLKMTFLFQLNFWLPKNESVLNISGYFLEQFQRFSRGLFSNICTLKCSQLISSSGNKKILLTTTDVRLDSGRYAIFAIFFKGIPRFPQFQFLRFLI